MFCVSCRDYTHGTCFRTLQPLTQLEGRVSGPRAPKGTATLTKRRVRPVCVQRFTHKHKYKVQILIESVV